MKLTGDNYTIAIEQKELFPTDSVFHSSYTYCERTKEIAEQKLTGKKPRIDLTGKRYGGLVVLYPVEGRHNNSPLFACRCDCGTIIKATNSMLRRKSWPLVHCGCKGVGKAGKIIKGGLGVGGVVHKKYANASTGKVSIRGLVNSLYANYRNGAIKRGLVFGLSKSEFRKLTKENCYYCGCEPLQEYTRKDGSDVIYIYNGIDRKDSNEGYTLSNCVACCGTCNKAKNIMTIAEFGDWVKRVCERWDKWGKL